ncbi:MAG: transglycosylase domain-containing protein [Anaerolineae bacterium]
MVHAVVSIENERYFEDPGWDPVAIVRAFLQNLSSGEVSSGASTITQQVARNLVLQDTTVSPERKLQEIVVAAEIARQYDKNFILQLYLNEIFFGNQSYGVEAASRFYFGHGASDLNLAEAALLAGVIQAPARYDPVINRQAAFDRMNVVLNQMAQVGCLQFSFAPYNTSPGFCITQADIASPRIVLQKAQVETRSYQPRQFTVKYPHFVNFVQQQIENNFGTSEMFRRGFEIQTTLNPRIQEVAQGALEQQVRALANNGVNTGAVMVTDPRDGAIRAMVGSPDFSDNSIDGQVNNAFTWQQPGSSIKVVEYVGALEGVNRNGTSAYYTPATVLWDVQTTFPNPNYTPINYDQTYHGPVALRYALANSYNVPAVKVLDFIGIDKFVDVAQRIGLRFLPEATFGLPSALGANEVRLYDMMQAYGTIANDGTRVPLYSITQIKDAGGNVVALPDRPQPALAVQPQIAFLMQNILSDNEARTPAFGAASPLNVSG